MTPTSKVLKTLRENGRITLAQAADYERELEEQKEFYEWVGEGGRLDFVGDGWWSSAQENRDHTTEELLNHLKSHQRITLAQAAEMEVYYLGKEISRIRARYGPHCIVTSHRMRRYKSGYRRLLEYCLSPLGRAVIFGEKHTRKKWITIFT